MAKKPLNRSELARIRKAVRRFEAEAEKEKFDRVAKNLHNDLVESSIVSPYVQFAKYRVKDPSHLEDKLKRKALEAKKQGKPFDIDENNIFEKVQDLAGVRLLHLHTQQMKQINPAVLSLLDELRYEVLEGPIANLWDEEYKNFFESIGVEVKMRADTLYTSVHYIVKANTKSLVCCELQIRTLSEELWGEVSHTVNYPDLTKSVACTEQLKVLARATSTCTRLVDSIFKSDEEYRELGGS